MNFNNYFNLAKNKSFINFDNGATAIKLDSVIKAEYEFLQKYNINTHNEASEVANYLLDLSNKTRQKVANFINVKNSKEIIFNSGSTEGMNCFAFGLKKIISKGDEVVTTSVDHTSTFLPLKVVCDQSQAKLKTFPLNNKYLIDLEKIEQVVNQKTKVVVFANVSNTFGYENNVEKIVKKIRQINREVIVLIDCAQGICHVKTDVAQWDIDGLVFSAHKLYGPFGLGVMWAKEKILDLMDPLMYGGGAITDICLNSYQLKKAPEKFEAGTKNLVAIYAFDQVFNFLDEVKFENIIKHEKELKDYFVKKINEKKIQGLKIYNLDNNQPTILFNFDNIHAQDVATFLEKKYKIVTRSGRHCAMIANDLIDQKATVRITLSPVNTKEEIDLLFEGFEHINEWKEYIY